MFSATIDITICLEADLLAPMIINSSSRFMSYDHLLYTHFCLQSKWGSSHSSVKINGTLFLSVCDQAMKYIKKMWWWGWQLCHSHPTKCLVWIAPKYQLNHDHDNKGGSTELINMWGMNVADNLQIKITFSLKKITMHKTAPVQWNVNKSFFISEANTHSTNLQHREPTNNYSNNYFTNNEMSWNNILRLRLGIPERHFKSASLKGQSL